MLGVGRVVTLFLVLAASADTREVVSLVFNESMVCNYVACSFSQSDKMLANLSFLSLSSPQDRLTPLLWRGELQLVCVVM